MAALLSRSGSHRIRPVLCAAGVLAALCAGAGPAGAREAADCIRRPLQAAASGEPVRGAEDLAVDRARGRLYLSAYDRTALEAVPAGGEPPQGAIYTVPLARVLGASGNLSVRAAVRGPLQGLPFHPHGIALGPSGALTAINHAYADGASRARTRLERFAPTAAGLAHRTTLADPRLCRANDLAVASDGTLLVTRDHGACSTLGRRLEDLLGLHRGEVLRVRAPDGAARIAVAARGLAIPNGIALGPGGERVFVAESRREQISVFDRAALAGQGADTADPARPVDRIALDGGPDNLSIGPDGELLAAVHPSLWRFALARYRVFGVQDAGTRVVGADLRSNSIRTLVDVPAGGALAGSTAAVRVDDALLVSSAIDDALLVCGRPRSSG